MRRFFYLLLALLFSQGIYGQVLTGNFMVGGYIRVYDVTLPSGWSPTANMPVVIDLHYLGADGRDEDSLTRFGRIADTAGFVVCHPYGSGTDWNVGQAAPFSTGLGDVTFIDQLIDTLHQRYGINLDRVYATGMGQGGFMAQMLACQLGFRLAAVATVGASIADSTLYYCNITRPMPTLIMHGTADSVVPYYAGLPGVWPPIPSYISYWRTHNVCGATEVAQTLPDLVQEGSTVTLHLWDCNPASQVWHYEVVGGGFSWPGSTRDLGSGGNRNMDIDASVEIWNFFKQFDINGLVGVTSSVSLGLACDVFPNPSGDWLHVRVGSGVLGQVTLRDMHGREVAAPSLRIDARSHDVDVRGLVGGVYLLEAAGVVKRIVVMH
jgi:polyhydroxybutyrate depolymerase